MLKRRIYFSLFLCIVMGGVVTDAVNKEENVFLRENKIYEADRLPIADPYVMLYNNKYYAYGTGGTTKGEGFACFSSDDLKNWKREGQALSAADSYGKWGCSR